MSGTVLSPAYTLLHHTLTIPLALAFTDETGRVRDTQQLVPMSRAVSQ